MLVTVAGGESPVAADTEVGVDVEEVEETGAWVVSDADDVGTDVVISETAVVEVVETRLEVEVVDGEVVDVVVEVDVVVVDVEEVEDEVEVVVDEVVDVATADVEVALIVDVVVTADVVVVLIGTVVVVVV
ncbi:MAG: hypothetical protein ACKOAQ_05280, partial [Acidimicrobiaceae bacterium]